MMKKNNTISVFSLCLLLLFTVSSLWAQKDKTINKEFSGIHDINIEHRGGPLFVKPSPDNKTHVRAMIAVEASSPEDAQKVFDQFDLQTSEQAGKLHLKIGFNVVNSINMAGKLRLTFKDGTKVKNLRNLSVSLEVLTPDLETLNITSKYHEIRIEEGVNIKENLTLHTYEGRLEVGNIQGNLDLDAKYTKGAIGNFSNAKLILYESKLQLGNGGQTDLNTKYSKLVFGQLESLKINSYEDEIETGTIQGDITVSDKYSKLQFGALRNAAMELYESKVSAPSALDMQLKSKYGEFKIDQVENVNFELSYEDNAEFGEIGSLTTINSKYGEFDIGTLKYLLALNSYEDDVTIKSIQNTLKGIILEGKYLKLEANLPDDLHFQLEANMKYGNLEYPGNDDDFDFLIYKEKGDDLEIKGKNKGATDSSPLIKIDTYEGKISLN